MIKSLSLQESLEESERTAAERMPRASASCADFWHASTSCDAVSRKAVHAVYKCLSRSLRVFTQDNEGDCYMDLR